MKITWAHRVSLFSVENRPQYHLSLINVRNLVCNWKKVDEGGRREYIRLAAWSIFTIFAMTCNLSGGTFSQMLNASISFPRISLPGLDVIYLNGSSKTWNLDLVFFKKKETGLESTCSSSIDHLGSSDNTLLRILSYFESFFDMEPEWVSIVSHDVI